MEVVPDDIITQISKFCSYDTLYSLSCLNQKYHRIVHPLIGEKFATQYNNLVGVLKSKNLAFVLHYLDINFHLEEAQQFSGFGQIPAAIVHDCNGQELIRLYQLLVKAGMSVIEKDIERMFIRLDTLQLEFLDILYSLPEGKKYFLLAISGNNEKWRHQLLINSFNHRRDYYLSYPPALFLVEKCLNTYLKYYYGTFNINYGIAPASKFPQVIQKELPIDEIPKFIKLYPYMKNTLQL